MLSTQSKSEVHFSARLLLVIAATFCFYQSIRTAVAKPSSSEHQD
jgi:hypothetical protein